jgi:hypothetical protein
MSLNRTVMASWTRWLGITIVLAIVLHPSCTPGFDPISQVNSVRIQAVNIDRPYALPGDEITMRMTLADGLGDVDGNPRDMQLLWIAGCFNPDGDQFFLCFEDLAEQLAPLATSGEIPADLVKFDLALASSDGVPDSHEFTFTLPEDIVSSREVPDNGAHYGIAYVFFAACAGQLRPAAELVNTGTGDVADFPLECIDDAGNTLGPDSFIIGYTQVYSFADERMNANPPLEGLTLDGMVMSEDLDQVPVVRACPADYDSRRTASCNEDPTEGCTKYELVPTFTEGQLIAERDAQEVDVDGEPLDEVVWVSYFVDGGTTDPDLALINDAREGLQTKIGTEWTPPNLAGLYSIWAVVRDQRGGSKVIRRFVRVE